MAGMRDIRRKSMDMSQDEDLPSPLSARSSNPESPLSPTDTPASHIKEVKDRELKDLGLPTLFALHNPRRIQIGYLIAGLSVLPAKLASKLYEHHAGIPSNTFTVGEKMSTTDEETTFRFKSFLEWFAQQAIHKKMILNLEFNLFFSGQERSAAISLIDTLIQIHRINCPKIEGEEEPTLYINLFGGGGAPSGRPPKILDEFSIAVPGQIEPLKVVLTAEDVKNIDAIVKDINEKFGKICRNGMSFSGPQASKLSHEIKMKAKRASLSIATAGNSLAESPTASSSRANGLFPSHPRSEGGLSKDVSNASPEDSATEKKSHSPNPKS